MAHTKLVGEKKESMKLSELIVAVGDENIQVQWLKECVVGAEMKKLGTHVTFGTTAISPVEVAIGEGRNVGVILWLPRNLIPDELKGKV